MAAISVFMADYLLTTSKRFVLFSTNAVTLFHYVKQ